MSRIKVNIGQLVLRGFELVDRNAVTEGLLSELSRVLADPTRCAEWAHSQQRPTLCLGKLPLEPGPSGRRQFGVGVARAIGKGLQ